MEVLKKQHRLLEILYEYQLEYVKSEYQIAHGLNWQEIADRLNVTSDQLYLIAGRLVEDGEITSEARDNPLLYAIKIPKGYASLAIKKYLKERENVIISSSKNFVSILIPLAALTLSFLIFIKAQNKQEQQDKEIKELKSEVQQLRMRIK